MLIHDTRADTDRARDQQGALAKKLDGKGQVRSFALPVAPRSYTLALPVLPPCDSHSRGSSAADPGTAQTMAPRAFKIVKGDLVQVIAVRALILYPHLILSHKPRATLHMVRE